MFVQNLTLRGIIFAAITMAFLVASVNTPASAAKKIPSNKDVKTYLRPAKVPEPLDNKLTRERVKLGKALFFDPRLSSSNFISCSTCHNPALGWADGMKTATGHGMKTLGRATPTILNTAFQTSQFWDGRAQTLEEQALGPIVAGGEMAQNLDELIIELVALPGYVKMFQEAYPGEGVTGESIAKAIASFERTIISTDSPFDMWLKGNKRAISTSAARGFNLFKNKARCVVCHEGFNFTDNGFHNIGLKGNTDDGRFAIKSVAVLKGAFKTPTLRDVALTAPYMHNGEFDTLEEVIDHYDMGGEKVEGLSPNMKPLRLSKAEKMDLVEFLKSLTGKPRRVTVPNLPKAN
ncbi:MAG: c-type cytochrome [Gammaproteobacteria bacterium]|nr:c-type cytochrome [Gammaproteobacteria bacterium]